MSKLDRARPLLYRRQILQENIRWKALDEIYKIYMLLHRSDVNISAKFRQTFSHFPRLLLPLRRELRVLRDGRVPLPLRPLGALELRRELRLALRPRGLKGGSILLSLQNWQNLQNFWRARSRLYQNEILRENMRLTTFFKLYKICILLHRCNLKIFAKNRFEKTATFVKFQISEKNCKCRKICKTLSNFKNFSLRIW